MKYLTIDEQKALVRTVRDTKGAERDYVIIETILHTGLRAAEAAVLTVGDVRNRQRLYVRPEMAKRGKGRFVPLNVRIQDVLRKWLARKMSSLHESIEDSAPLFVSRLGGRLSKRSLQEAVEHWMIRSGLTTARDGRTVPLYSVHSLRHSFAKRLIERGVEPATIQKILGHASLASTGVYIEATDQELDEAVHTLAVSEKRAARMREAL